MLDNPLSMYLLFCFYINTHKHWRDTNAYWLSQLPALQNQQSNKQNKKQKRREEDKTSILLFYTELFLQYYSYNFSFSFIWLMLAPHKTVLKFLLQRSSNAQKWTAKTSTVVALWYNFRIFSVFIVELNSFLWSGVLNWLKSDNILTRDYPMSRRHCGARDCAVRLRASRSSVYVLFECVAGYKIPWTRY